MAFLKYDEQADCLYVQISSKKPYLTFELNGQLAVDLTQSNIPVGVEILEAAKFISNLFGRQIAKEKIKRMLCHVERKEQIYIDFEMPGSRRQCARLAIPTVYESPVVSVA